MNPHERHAAADCSPSSSPVRVADFSAAYERFSDPIRRYCCTRLGEPAFAEDVTADVFVSAYRAFGRVEHDELSVRRWLFTIARNAVADHRRATTRLRRALERVRVQPQEQVDIAEIVGRRQEARVVRRAMGELGVRDRHLIGLRVVDGMSYPEMARMLRSTEGAMRMATRRAVGRLHALLATTPAPGSVPAPEPGG